MGENELKECFAACLYTCYDLIRPDMALEVAWRTGKLDFAMPYLVQVLREYTGRVDALDKKTQKREEAEEKAKSAPNDFVADYVAPMMGIGGPNMGMLAIQGPGAGGMMGGGMQQPGMGMGQPQMGGGMMGGGMPG